MKKIIIVLLIGLMSCSDGVVNTKNNDLRTPGLDIFNTSGVLLKDGQLININIPAKGKYKISLVDEFSNLTFTNEVIDQESGSSTFHIYTYALPKGSYSLNLISNKGDLIKSTHIKI